MKGVFRIDQLVNQPGSNIVYTGLVKSGQLFPGMEAVVENKVLKISEIYDLDDHSLQLAVIGQNVKLLVVGASYDFLKSLEGLELEFQDAQHNTKKSFAFKPTVA